MENLLDDIEREMLMRVNLRKFRFYMVVVFFVVIVVVGGVVFILVDKRQSTFPIAVAGGFVYLSISVWLEQRYPHLPQHFDDKS